MCTPVASLAGLLLLALPAVSQDPPPADSVVIGSGAVDTTWTPLPDPSWVPYRFPLAALATVGGHAEELHRLDILLGRASGPFSMLRSPSSQSLPLTRTARVSFAVLAPEMVSVWNSDLPFSFNEGALWAGRGASLLLSAGVRMDAGPVRAVLAPELSYSANREFQVLPFHSPTDPSRHRYSSPWHYRPASLDLPSRFGEVPATEFHLGQSSLGLDVGPVTFGIATENLWWGPGIRNAIVMSNHAPGIPHAFLRSSRPLRTRVGDLEGRWILGRLEESAFYDDNPENDQRSLSAIAVSLRPALEPNLTLGFTRAVYAPAGEGGVRARAAIDVFHSVGRPNAPDDLLQVPAADQLFSLFGRWVFPEVGVEAYGEWARYDQPVSLRDFLEMPHHSQGYTLGLQWARTVALRRAVRLQMETTYLEPSATYRHRPVISWYASRAVEQGYTHRGQVIGASIGPGASSQWLAVDYFGGEDSQLGAFAGRIRWDNAIFYEPTPRPFFAHDVSVFMGLRGGHPLGFMRISAELSTGVRLNYLFQNLDGGIEGTGAVDLRNTSLRLHLAPRIRPR